MAKQAEFVSDELDLTGDNILIINTDYTELSKNPEWNDYIAKQKIRLERVLENIWQYSVECRNKQDRPDFVQIEESNGRNQAYVHLDCEFPFNLHPNQYKAVNGFVKKVKRILTANGLASKKDINRIFIQPPWIE